MHKHTIAKKNKINLADYNYKRDIENRLLMSHFSAFDVEVLEEILHSSLTLQLSNLAASLEADSMEVMVTVDKLSQTGLLKRTGEMINVDKEMRKYYEFQALKFDEDFHPDMSYLQATLKKLPIHLLPVWYAIPRTSTNIFDSLMEKYLATPRLFQRYLLELTFDDPMPQRIMEEVFASDELMLRSRDLRQKFDLSREQFEEYMLLLEYNFVLCLTYIQVDDQWKEVVVPFQEWREYLLFMRESEPKSLQADGVNELRGGELAFVQDLARLLNGEPMNLPADYHRWIEDKIQLLELMDHKKEWLELPLEDQAMTLLRHQDNRILSTKVDTELENEKNLREVEKALGRIPHNHWIDFGDFLKGVTTAIGHNEGPTLKKQGRRWAYVIPEYNEQEQLYVKAAVFERFFEAGFVSIGDYQERPVFRLTNFGRSLLATP